MRKIKIKKLWHDFYRSRVLLVYGDDNVAVDKFFEKFNDSKDVTAGADGFYMRVTEKDGNFTH